MMGSPLLGGGRKVEVKPASAYGTFVDVVRQRADSQPNFAAYVFLTDGDDQQAILTYAELNARARAVAIRLREVCAPGDRALLVYEPGLEYIVAYFGCLYAGVVAVPAYPPEPARLEKTLPRLQVIADDSSPSVVLASSMVMPLKDFFVAMHPGTSAKTWINTEEIRDGGEGWAAPNIGRDSLAFLQYTSGSTKQPRGVMVTHGNLLDNVATSCVTGKYGPDDSFVSWLPQYHDMGLIGGILQPLYGGFLGVLMSPMSFLQRPSRWLRAITKYRGRTSAFPNFALELCTNRVNDEHMSTLDLRTWKIAVNGSEPVRPASVLRFNEKFAACGFDPDSHCPGYGLAEATLIVTFNAMHDAPRFVAVDGNAFERHKVVLAAENDPHAKSFMSCGRTLGDMRVRIVNAKTCVECAPDEVGEIWAAGPSLAKGYWQRPDETETTFNARIASTDEGPFLRTGDLGFLHEGELFVTGRIKDMIIDDGANHYPQDIEATLEASHHALRPGCSAAFSVERDGQERLVIVAEASENGSKLDREEVTKAVRAAVSSNHALRVYEVVLLKPRALPKTSSGKLQRHACRAGYLAGALDVVER